MPIRPSRPCSVCDPSVTPLDHQGPRGSGASFIGGFTLLELMVTLVVLGILMSLAAPSFNDFIVEQRVRNASFDLLSALTYTRSEAIKRNATVTLARSGSDWNLGWSVSAPVNGTVTVLQNWGPYPGLAVATTPDPLTGLTFGRNGRPASVSGNVVLHLDDSDSNPRVCPRNVGVDLSGKAYANREECL